MIKVTPIYREVAKERVRESYVVAKYGLYDKVNKNNISSVSTSVENSISNVSQTYDNRAKHNFNYITNEKDRVKLDGSFCFLTGDNNPNEQVGFWSKFLSSSSGVLITEPAITYNFNKNIPFTEVTLSFQEVCSNFIVTYYLGNTKIAIREITNNSSLVVSTSGTMISSVFNKIVLTFQKTLIPGRYLKFNEIDLGIIMQFNSNQIVDYDIIQEMSIKSTELSADSLNLKLENSNKDYDILNPENKLNDLTSKQEIALYHYLKVDNNFVEIPLGTYIIKDFIPTKESLEIESYSDIYFMNDIYYGSKFYDNVSMRTILEDLFSYFGYTNYTLDSVIDDILLTGYVPNVQFREALRIIAEAGQCVINKQKTGGIYIYRLKSNRVQNFNRELIFNENPERYLYEKAINVIEYDYNTSKENEVVYEGTFEKSGKPYNIVFSSYPVDETTIATDNPSAYIVEKYATGCVIKTLANNLKVKITATLKKPNKLTRQYGDTNYENYDVYSIKELDNTLVTKTNVKSVANWKLDRSEILYNFDTLTLPYIECGDSCAYQTNYSKKGNKYKEINDFVVTKIEYSKSILQNIEGEGIS